MHGQDFRESYTSLSDQVFQHTALIRSDLPLGPLFADIFDPNFEGDTLTLFIPISLAFWSTCC